MTKDKLKSGDNIRADVAEFLQMSSSCDIRTIDELKARLANCLKFVKEEIAEIEEVLDSTQSDEMLLAKLALETTDLIWTAHNLSCALDSFKPGLFDMASDDVKRANFTKFCVTEEEANKTQELYADGLHFSRRGQRIDTTVHRVATYRRVVWAVKDSNGKTMKSYKQVPVDAEVLAYEYFT